MKKSRQVWFLRKNIGHLVLLVGVLILLSACGIVKDTIDGMTGKELNVEVDKDSNSIIVEVVVESDGDSVVNLGVDINARKNPESVHFDSIEVPYREEFVVPKDVPIPLTPTLVKAEVADGASWVSCTILYDGEVVATHMSRRDGGKAVCEKSFQLGPG
ncbi:hypothetical protein [uncultured Brevibacillus sp.]|uniref:hypothetical protein n=1 Tax=uncultured Brevibacillus sp. TaxID=169970 RepID=UPI002598115C|nr:hypothetical protein [uncultured Brevibacillus sp.]